MAEQIDFVFLDIHNRPRRCKTWGGDCWLFYWHSDKKWVSDRAVTEAEVARFPRNLSEKEQQLYMDNDS